MYKTGGLNVLKLNFEIDEDFDFPATFLSSLWQLRTEKKKVELFKIRTDFEAQVRLLRESRLTQTTEMIINIFD